MTTKVKIKIQDDDALRKILDANYSISSQRIRCKYATQ